MIGETISHYKILEKLGEGGMGVVYKAEDTKLDRTIALKFLPKQFSINEEEKKRFVHEAKAAASLDHPNICSIHEINETEDGQMFIAMAYYEGETLKDKIANGPLPIADSINIAIQTAEGLSEAKKKRIIHRDIKSSNIIINKDSLVKIMDFGLAKLQGATKLTKEGTTLGTVAYMSPEQTSREKMDHRSDIWSLGVALYEMVTGQLPFKGEYEQAIMYAIMNEKPEPLTAVRTGVPVPLENIVTKMLAKDPAKRYQNIKEVIVDLKAVDILSGQVSTELRPSGLPSDTKKQLPLRRELWWKLVLPAVFGVIILSSLMTWLFQNSRPESPPLVKRFTISPNLPKEMVISESAAISPDGKCLVYRANDGVTDSLFLKTTGSFKVTRIDGSENASYPFFSPDSRWIVFKAKGKLQKKLLTGGHPFTICDVNPTIHGGVWRPDGKIVLGSFRRGLVKVSATGGALESLTTPEENMSHRWPQILADGKTVLFTIWPSQGHSLDFIKFANLALFNTNTKKTTILIKGGSCPQYLSPGYLLYGVSSGNLMAVSFDPKRNKINSIPIPIIEDLLISGTGYSNFSVSGEDSLLYKPAPKSSKYKFFWVDLSGREKPLGIQPAGGHSCISPDGNSAIFNDGEEKYWIYNFSKGNKIRLTFDRKIAFLIYHPEGDRVTYTKSNPDTTFIVEKFLDGRTTENVLMKKNQDIFCGSWSPDGKYLTFYEFNPETGRDIGFLSLPENTMHTFLATKAEETSPVFSPDGKWLAYVSNKTGRFEIYIHSFPSGHANYQISDEGGVGPVWSPNGKKLYFQSKFRVMVANIKTKPVFKRGIPRKLFAGKYRMHNYYPAYDIHPDGKRFLMSRYEDEEVERKNQLKLILNFTEELKRNIPRGK